jgi:hypothetical protein
MRSRWRALFFLIVLAASAALGLHWHAAANRPVAAVPSDAPLKLNVFVTDRSARVTLSTDLEQNESCTVSGSCVWFEQVTLLGQVSGKGTVLITSNRPDEPDPTPQFKPSHLKNAGPDFAYTFTAPAAAVQPGYFETSFDLPSKYIIDTSGGPISARLPEIGGLEDTPDGPPAGLEDLSEADPSFGVGSRRKLVYAPVLPKGATTPTGDPKTWLDNTGKPMQALFYPPAALSVSETLDNGGNAVSGSDVLTDLPASSANNHALVWRGSFGLSPVLRAVPRSTEETEKSDEFLSGVALATGAAGLVAFVQEAPDQLRLRRKRHATDDDAEASADNDEASTDAEARRSEE